ncbi:hypothetical protein HEN41_022435 [Escherichia coli]|nr:hypothetical protein [Escherichia coli]
MATDITYQTLREKFEAWWEREYKHLESSKYTDAVPHIKYGFWMAYQAGGAELVEALEKAQQRISQLESRTVNINVPDARNEDYDWDGQTPSEAFNTCRTICTLMFRQSLRASGIKVEAE